MDNSYLRSLVTALRQNIEVLYITDNQAFSWQAYGSLWPTENEVYGAIASQFERFPKTYNLDNRPGSTPHTLLTQLEIRIKGSGGSDDFGLIYDHHEFVINHLNLEVGHNGITGTFANNELNQAFLGLEITRTFAGVNQGQDDLTKMRSVINFQWEYMR